MTVGRRSIIVTAILTISLGIAGAVVKAHISGEHEVVLRVANIQGADCVILVHGLARTSGAMQPLADVLNSRGFTTINVNYPSTQYPIETLAPMIFPDALAACENNRASGVHVVTHSLGGILLRQYLDNHDLPGLDRVVMLAPPNHGSEVVDALGGLPGYVWINGPAGLQMGTGADSVPKRLGGVNAELAVIAGSATFNPILSQWLPNPDDGKVSVASARLQGMCGFLVVDVSHPFIMKDDRVMAEVVAWLEDGQFRAPDAEYPACMHQKES